MIDNDVVPPNPSPATYWKNRRMMAWICLVWIILQTFLWGALAIFMPTTMPTLGAVVGWSYACPMAILGAYYGTSSLDDLFKRKREW